MSTDKAKEISSTLRDRIPLPENLEQELDKLIKTSFPGSVSSTPGNILSELDSLGCEIWNAATKIIRGDDSLRDAQAQADGSTRAATLFRVFAFMLVDFAYQSRPKRQKDQDKLIRNFKIGLKACQHCLDKAETDLVQVAIHRCADYVAAVTGDSPLVQITKKTEDSDDRATLKRLASEFGLLRITHAWMIGRLDLAEHFYNELLNSYLSEVPRLAENAADSLYQIGKSLFTRNLVEPAARWLQRAINALDTCDIVQLSQEAFDLRLAISASLGEQCGILLISASLTDTVNCFVATRSSESLQQAQSLVRELDVSHGCRNQIAVHLLQLKVLLATGEVNEEELSSVMSRVIRSAVLSEHTFTT